MILSTPQGEFISFLLDAKCQTYAAQGDDATVMPLLPGSRQLEYQKGNLFYRDVYFGGAFFIGQETVYEDSTPVWGMCYGGGVIKQDAALSDVYAFLRAALRQVSAERPFRGPSQWREGVFAYIDDSLGDLERFWGKETITFEGHPVYQLRYNGGIIK